MKIVFFVMFILTSLTSYADSKPCKVTHRYNFTKTEALDKDVQTVGIVTDTENEFTARMIVNDDLGVSPIDTFDMDELKDAKKEVEAQLEILIEENICKRPVENKSTTANCESKAIEAAKAISKLNELDLVFDSLEIEKSTRYNTTYLIRVKNAHTNIGVVTEKRYGVCVVLSIHY